jgi:VCBS repeat-containing protein
MREFTADLITLTDIPIDLSADFWPLSGGTPELGASLTLDGNNFDLIFGSPNRLDEFEVYADSQILLDFDDGVDASTISLESGNISIITTGNFSINAEEDFQFDYDNGLGDLVELFFGDNGGPTMTISTTDGVTSTSLSLTPTDASITLDTVYLQASEDLIGFGHINGNFISVADTDVGIGGPINIDSTNINIVNLPASSGGLSTNDCFWSTNYLKRVGTNEGFELESFTVAGAPSASGNPRIAYCSDESGGATPVYSDGSNWRRFYDGNVIS